MLDYASKLKPTLFDPAMEQSVNHLPVLVSPSRDVFVIAVNGNEVISPESEIAPAHMPFGELRFNSGHYLSKHPEAAQVGDMRKPYDTILLEHHTATTHEVAFLHDVNMVLDKMTLGDNVTIDFYDIVTLCFRNCLVEYDGSAKTAVIMPDVTDWYGKGISYMVNKVLCVSARSVICYNYFIGQYRLQAHSV